MRVRNRVTPPVALGNQQQGRSGKAGAGGSQGSQIEKLKRFAAAQKSKRAGKYKGARRTADDDEEMSDFDAALVGAYERSQGDADGNGQQQHPQDDPSEPGKDEEALPKFPPPGFRRI